MTVMPRAERAQPVDPERVDFEQNNLVAALLRWERSRPNDVAYRFLERGEREAASLTWSRLAERARTLAGELQHFGDHGDRVLLLLEPGLDFVVAFLSCAMAGMVAVPVAPPKPREGLKKLRLIAESSRPKLLLTSSRLADSSRAMREEDPCLARCRVIELDALDVASRPARAFRGAALGPDDLAFLQYTSGSTGNPKGVSVTHRNVLSNVRMMVEAFGQDQSSIIVGWLPLYHDMGLLGNVVGPVYLGASVVLMSPVDFIVSPRRWLAAISRYRATISGGPNFAFELCASRVAAEELAGLDLSSWNVAFCGAEPVRASSMKRFADAFAPAGFDAKALCPCYGMAECTLFAAGRAKGSGIEELWLDTSALEEHRVVVSESGQPSARSVVACGRTWPEQEVIIVDPETCVRVSGGAVGEIWIRGPHVAAGYFERPELSRAGFGARPAGDASGNFLRSGDLGFVRDGQLFITGRLTEMIIIRGRNYYAEDLELSARRADPAFEGSTRGAAFAQEQNGQEQLVIVHEVRREELSRLSPARVRELEEKLRSAIADEHGVQPAEVVLVRPGSIPCTTSGKVRRRECRTLNESRQLGYLPRK